MKAAVLILAALPLAAQPKLLVNAQVNVRTAQAGLATAVKEIVASSALPAWIGYTVPALKVRGSGSISGCDYVRDGGATAGVVHLEPADEAVILFRVERNAVERIRALSAYCEIDAGGLPVHWIQDAKANESVALLTTFTADSSSLGDGAMSAIAAHGDGAASAALERFLAADEPEWQKLRAVSRFASRGPAGIDVLRRLISSDTSQNVRRRAASALANVPEGAGVPVLIDLARTSQDIAIRKQAMTSLQQSRDTRAIAFFEEVLKK